MNESSMNDLEMLKFVSMLQITADLIHSGMLARAVMEIERRRRLGNLPLMGDDAYEKFLRLCKDLCDLKSQIESIAKDGARFEQFMKTGSSGFN